MPSEKEMRRLGQVTRRRVEEIAKTRPAARSYLVGMGIDAPDGNLPQECGGKPHEARPHGSNPLLSRM